MGIIHNNNCKSPTILNVGAIICIIIGILYMAVPFLGFIIAAYFLSGALILACISFFISGIYRYAPGGYTLRGIFKYNNPMCFNNFAFSGIYILIIIILIIVSQVVVVPSATAAPTSAPTI